MMMMMMMLNFVQTKQVIFELLASTPNISITFYNHHDLGMLQRENPGIAISVKTRQAIRTVLNNARDVANELRGGGLLDEAEYSKLESVSNYSQTFSF